MHSIRSRPICRARNTFSPSTALWQHFIAPSQYLLQRPPASPFTNEAAQSLDHGNVSPSGEKSHRGLRKEIRWLKNTRGKKSGWTERPGLSKYRNDGSGRRMTPGSRRESEQDLEDLLKKTYEAYDSAQDYEGVIVKPMYSRNVQESEYPWVVPGWEAIQSAEERSNLEIKKFHEFIRPSQAENLARKHLIEQVREHTRKVLPNYILEVFGSERTGIAFAGSDIDLRLVPKDVMADAVQSKLPPSPKERAQRRADLRRLHWHFIRHHKAHYLLPTIRWARYPLISLQDRSSGLDVQVVLSNDTSLSREYMQRYVQEYPYLPEIYSVIKAALDIRGLTDVFRGGIGSYSLFMMIVASLKHKPHPSNGAAGAVKHFLLFWGKFESQEHGVSVDPPEYFDKSEQHVMHEKAMGHIVEGKIRPLPEWMLTLRDPADETNDLGRKIVAWKHVQATMRAMLNDMRADKRKNTRPSLLASLVGPIYTLQRGHRKKLAEYGSSLAQAARQHGTTGHQSQETVDGDVQEHAGSHPSALDELAVIAQSIRKNNTANKHPACEAEGVDTGGKDEEDGLNPWLRNTAGPTEHKETEEAFSNLLGLDKKAEVNKQEG